MDARFPPEDEVVLGRLLDRWAEEKPDETFVVFDDGDRWTYGRLREIVDRTANALAGLGLEQGGRLVSWQPNGKDALRTWFAANRLGATCVPINTAYRGHLLQHVVNNAGADVAVVHHQLLERLGEVDVPHLRTAVVMGGTGHTDGTDKFSSIPGDVLDEPDSEPRNSCQSVRPWDLQSILYTSGTTGPSKGVLSSYLHLHQMGTSLRNECTPADRHMVDLPLFHAGGTMPVFAMLSIGGSIALTSGFRTEGYWDLIRRTGATVTVLLGVMATFLRKQPPAPEDRDHPLRLASSVPLMDDAPGFAARFGVRIRTGFNMTETSVPISSEDNPAMPGYCGRPRDGVEARVVDSVDREVAPGEVGELVLRADMPWAMSHGYHDMPEATAQAWRNGWFHTGDAFRYDADGRLFFVDRRKDSIRRRGENISSFEVEAEVIAHPAVKEVAAVAIPNVHEEDEVLIAVAPVEGEQVDPAELFDFLRPRMAYFMLPRYIRVLDALPRTPTNKVQKYLLREEGVPERAWDREAAGITVKRERLT